MAYLNALNGFFKEYPDTKQAMKWTVIVALALIIALLGISVVPGQTPATFYLYFLVIVFLLGIMEFMNEKMQLVSLNFFGNPRALIIALLVGVVVGYLIVSNQLAIIGSPLKFSADSNLNFFYIVVVSVLAEEMFFRGFLFPTINQLSGNSLIALLGANGAFAAYHFYVYILVLNLSIVSVLGAFIFGVLVTIGNQYFKSLGFGIGAHGINNYIAFAATVIK